MFLSTWQPQPVLLAAGPVHIYWYGFFLALGSIAGLGVILRLNRTAKLLPAGSLIDLFVTLVIGGFVGGRLYHVLNEWGYYRAHPDQIWQVWNGGLAIHGAMIVGLFIIWLAARRHKLNAWLLTDMLVIGLAVGQAFGRWGNYFNQELFGRPTNLPWKIIIDPTHRPPGFLNAQFFHPTFLYESLGCGLLAIGLGFLFHQRLAIQKSRWMSLWTQPGTITLTYFILYSILRIGMESLRIDQVPIVAGVRFPLLTSVIILAIAICIWIVRSMNQRHAQSH